MSIDTLPIAALFGPTPSQLEYVMFADKPAFLLMPTNSPAVNKCVIRDFKQFKCGSTILLYKQERVTLTAASLPCSSGVQTTGLTLVKVDVYSPAPSRSIHKSFIVIGWEQPNMNSQSQERLLATSGFIAIETKLPVILGAQLNGPQDEIQRMIQNHNEQSWQSLYEHNKPAFSENGYLPSMTEYCLDGQKKLIKLKINKCHSRCSKCGSISPVIIASAELQFESTSCRQFESKTIGTLCSLRIAQREPRHTGG